MKDETNSFVLTNDTLSIKDEGVLPAWKSVSKTQIM